jgi:hypothetical protein
MTCPLLAFSKLKNLEKRSRRQIEYRLPQFAVQLEYRVQSLARSYASDGQNVLWVNGLVPSNGPLPGFFV